MNLKHLKINKLKKIHVLLNYFLNHLPDLIYLNTLKLVNSFNKSIINYHKINLKYFKINKFDNLKIL